MDSSEYSRKKCLKCGYTHAEEEADYESGKIYTECDRCGYCECKVIIGKLPKGLRYLYRKGGRGIYLKKPDATVIGISVGPVKKGLIQELREQAEEMVECRYTFKRNGQWFIKDLKTNKKVPYSRKVFFKKVGY